MVASRVASRLLSNHAQLRLSAAMATLALGFSLTALPLLSGCASAGKEAQAAGMPPMPVTLHRVASQPYTDSGEFMAQVNSKHATDIRPQVSSRVVRVLVTDGQFVQAGQALYQLDVSQQSAVVSSLNATRQASTQEPLMLQKNIEGLQADLKAAQSDLAFSRNQLARYRELLSNHTVSAKDTEQYQTAVATQEQKAKSLQASIAAQQVQRRAALANISRDAASWRSAKANLAYYTVRAPFSGTVGTLNAKQGDVVDPATVLTTLTDNRNLEIEVAISADYRARMHLGTPVALYSMLDEPLGQVKTTYIDPKVDPMTQTFLLKAKAANPDNRLAMDQHLKARLIWGENRAILVPVVAVFRVDGQPFVYRAEDSPAEKGQPAGLKAHMQAVTLGPIIGQQVVVQSGLKAGETIVEGGIQKLQEGAPVMEAQAPTAAETRPH